MRWRNFRIAIGFAIPVIGASSVFADDKDKKPSAAIIREVQQIDGFTVRIDVSLLGGTHGILGDKTLRLLRADFARIETVVPEAVVEQWKKVTIVVDREHPLKNMQYHPSRDWLLNNGYEGDLEKCVHIAKAGVYASADHYFVQPCALIHELAHAYHDQVLGFENPRIKGAFARAQLEGNYESVLFVKGGKRKHYALSNHKEYFAEATEAWFGQNDFYPFVRGELEEHDPLLFELFKEIWKG